MSFAIDCYFFPHIVETVKFDRHLKRKTNTRIHAENDFKPEESCNEKEFRCETGKCIPRNHRCEMVAFEI